MLNWLKRFFSTRTVYTVKIVYKSGYTHDFKVYEFHYHDENYEWEAVDASKAPLIMGVDNVEAVWKLGKKKSFWSLNVR